MPHDLEILPDGSASMFSARVTPWHRLGVVTPDVLTAADAIEAAGLNWTVCKQPVYRRHAVLGSDGVTEEFEEIPDRFALERNTDGKVLSIVSDVYRPFQNVNAFSFMDSLVDSGEAKYETAGSLRGGRVVFVTMKTPRDILVGGEDRHETYLLLRTTHDGTGRISVYVVTVRVVCMNTLTYAIRNAKHQWGVTHTADVGAKVQQAREALNLTFTYDEAFQAEAEALLDIRVSDDEIAALLTGMLPDRPRRDAEVGRVLANIRGSDTVANYRGTAWGALNGVAEFYEHVKTNRSGEALFGRLIDGQQFKLRTELKNRLLDRT